VAARARGDRVGTWYAEKKSGGTMARGELARLREDARAGLVRRLYVFRLDRLTRTGIRDTLSLVEELRAVGTEVVTIADGFDLAGPASEVVLAVMAWASQMERLATLERLAAARRRLEASGRRWGRPKRMSKKEVEAARAMRGEGASLRRIAMAVHVPLATVARALRGAAA
jgi:DNA invertase Pin-like site-specific DNA recombinase